MKILDVPQSGSVAGVVSSRNRYGQYRRSRSNPVNPSSARQIVVRARFGGSSSAWRALPEETQLAWNNYATANPRTDSLGQTVVLTGAQMFVAQSLAMQNVGLAAEPGVPTLGLPATPSLTVTSLVDDGTALLNSNAVVSATIVLTIEASAPQSPGVVFMADYRFVKRFNAVLVAGAVDVSAEYVAKFGIIPTGSKVFFRARLTRVTSQPGLFGSAAAITTAA